MTGTSLPRGRVKKFYQSVTIGAADGAFAILLDGKAAKTRARKVLALPKRRLADAVAQEWNGEGETVDFDAMRLTRLAVTAIDLGETQRDVWIGDIVAYAQSDLLCYRAAEPMALRARQAADWSPCLDWARTHLGADFRVTDGVVAVVQPDAATEAVRRAANSLDGWRLLGAWQATVMTGSAVLGLALERGAFAPPALFAASRLDERFQREQWGADEEAVARETRIEEDFLAVARWLELLV